jgi:hypothetical protein
VNLFCFNQNSPIILLDPDGLISWGSNPTYPLIFGPSPMHDLIATLRHGTYCAGPLSALSPSIRPPFNDLSDTFTGFYQRRFPNTVAYAKDLFTKQFNLWISGLSRSLSEKERPTASDLMARAGVISINNYDPGRRGVPRNAQDESHFGDERQSDYFASLCLGNYTIAVRDLSFSIRYDNLDRFNWSWSANVVVLDDAGLDRSDLGAKDSGISDTLYRVWSALFPKSTVIVAKFKISGSGIVK